MHLNLKRTGTVVLDQATLSIFAPKFNMGPVVFYGIGTGSKFILKFDKR